MVNGSELNELLLAGAGKLGIELSSEQVGMLVKYKELLVDWNQRINLTAIEEDRDIVIKHFIDSFTILPYIREEAQKSGAKTIKLIDVGTGAGFPGIPARIADSSLQVLLLDSLDKRVKFLNTVVSELGLTGITGLHGRAEEAGLNAKYRESFDISTARAVASLPVLLEYCLPFTKTGGLFIAMKGSDTEEIETSGKALEILGGKIEKVRDMVLPFSDIKRNIIIVRKLRQTPTKYPRKAGKPSKEPLI